MKSNISKNFKEMIEFIPIMQEATRKGIERELKDHVHDVDRIKLERMAFKKTFSLLQSKWTLDIIYVIKLFKKAYFNEIKKILTGINSRILTDRLRLLEKKRLVIRTLHDTKPVHVSYELTDIGNGIWELIIPLIFYIKLSKTDFLMKKKFVKREERN